MVERSKVLVQNEKHANKSRNIGGADDLLCICN